MVERSLSPSCWQARQAAHEARVDEATAAHRARRAAGREHPVEDFLFRYYPTTPAQLRRWHPGAGVLLEGARRPWRFYAVDPHGSRLDLPAFLERRGEAVRFVHDLLAATASRPPHLGCFGLHEWAMAYRSAEHGLRHSSWPLRLGPEGTDEVVRSHRIRCSHYDAHRFFTPPAVPLNTLSPTRATQVELEQPGCLHAGMDLYKWAIKLTPLVPSELVVDCFEHARAARLLDMQAAPYDLRELGVEPVPIETADGRARYVRRQRELAQASAGLRARLLEVCAAALAQRGSTPAASSP